MPINSISSPSSPADIRPVASQATPPSSSLAANAANGFSIDISTPGKLLGDLARLAQSDPAKFKAVTADIAQKLKDAAGTESGGRADFLNKLAERFDSASQSGSASDLAPTSGKMRGHHHGGHHHAKGAAGAAGPGVMGEGGGDSVAQVVQGIVSGALGAAGPSTPTGPSTSTST